MTLELAEVYAGRMNGILTIPRLFKYAKCDIAIKILENETLNHPSGDPSPSEADLRLTRRLSEASRILQIQMLDHVIIGQPMNGRQGYFTFKEAGTIG